MKIEIQTKYNIGDEVFIINDNNIYKVKILTIYIKCQTISKESDNAIKAEINYQTNCKSLGFRTFEEKQLFTTKEDLFEYLSKNL